MSISRLHRLSKALIGGSIAVFCLLVGYNNIIDFNTNFHFVQHVLSMDAMQPWFDGKALLKRAITSYEIQFFLYCLIIISEICSGLFLVIGAAFMLKGSGTGYSTGGFSRGQALFLIGGTLAILTWYFGFAVIGAEWFQMWASTWNGQMKAYTFASFILITMIYTIIPSPQAWD